jgi:hypothetical protein
MRYVADCVSGRGRGGDAGACEGCPKSHASAPKGRRGSSQRRRGVGRRLGRPRQSKIAGAEKGGSRYFLSNFTQKRLQIDTPSNAPRPGNHQAPGRQPPPDLKGTRRIDPHDRGRDETEAAYPLPEVSSVGRAGLYRMKPGSPRALSRDGVRMLITRGPSQASCVLKEGYWDA